MHRMTDGDVSLNGQENGDPDGGEEGDAEEDSGDVEESEDVVLQLSGAAHDVLRHDVGR